MTTPTLTAIEALEQAIEMLESIRRGFSYPAIDFISKVNQLERARDAHHEQAMKAARGREQIRELSRQRRKA